MADSLLTVTDLHAHVVDGPAILKGVNLTVKPGEVHAIMGPNGSGKSTLTKTIAGHEGYEVSDGSVLLDGTDLAEMSIDERVHQGLFIGFQYPVEVPGVNNADFLRLAVNAKRKAAGQEELSTDDFTPLLKQAMKQCSMDEVFAERDLNAGFSGGQKKRNEILQMVMLEPKLAILDETDSGLDIDALRIVADGINGFRSEERGFILITHYQRLLDLVKPDVVHIFADGHIVKSGGFELAEALEAGGYDGVMG